MIHTAEEFLARIRVEPDADAPRLVYADWLDEREPVRPSRYCTMCVDGKVGECDLAGDAYSEFECQSCMGTGKIHGPPDTGNKDRAELIRTQIALHTRKPPGDCDGTFCDGSLVVCPFCRETKRLLKREKEILAVRTTRWRAGPLCTNHVAPDGLSWNQWSGECRRCRGGGDAGGLAAAFYYFDHDQVSPQQKKSVKVRYVRGMKYIDVPLSECLLDARRPSRPVPSVWLLSVVTHHPDVVAVIFSDCTTKLALFTRTPKPVWEETVRFSAVVHLDSLPLECVRGVVGYCTVGWARSFLDVDTSAYEDTK